MMVLYDEEEIMRSYVESEIYEATQKGRQEGRREGILEEKLETAKRMLKIGKFSSEEIAVASGLTIDEVEKLADSL